MVTLESFSGGMLNLRRFAARSVTVKSPKQFEYLPIYACILV